MAKQIGFGLHFKMPVAGGAKQLAVNHVSILPIVVVCAKGTLKGFLFYPECGLGLFNKLTANFKCALIAIDRGLVIVTVVFAFFCATIATSNVLGWGVVATRPCIYRKKIQKAISVVVVKPHLAV